MGPDYRGVSRPSSFRRSTLKDDDDNDSMSETLSKVSTEPTVLDLKHPDDWVRASERSHCHSCGAEFGIFRPKNHCRKCGEVVCAECVVKKPIVLPMIGQTTTKFCVPCIEGFGNTWDRTMLVTGVLAPSPAPSSSSSSGTRSQVSQPSNRPRKNLRSQSRGRSYLSSSQSYETSGHLASSRSQEGEANAHNPAYAPLRFEDLIHPDKWVPNSHRKHCVACNNAFGLFRHKHHCRVCGELVCKDCTMMRQVVLPAVGLSDVRVCEPCIVASTARVAP
ncbi:unnamed protein product [Aphanomyces euteiches]